MCTTLFSYNFNPNYPIIIASNRDEFYERPTSDVSFWNKHPNIIGGIDKKYLGTWLGMSKEGKIGILTNFRDPKNHQKNLKSRGLLLKNFLTEDVSIDDFIQMLKKNKDEYNGYNILFGDISKMVYYSNKENKIKVLDSGIFGLSNAFLDTPWPKVIIGKKLLANEVKNVKPNSDQIMNILKNNTIAIDDDLPDTGIGIEYERMLSPIFIRSPQYGTRSSIVIMIDKELNVTFIEDIYNPEDDTFLKNKFAFKIIN